MKALKNNWVDSLIGGIKLTQSDLMHLQQLEAQHFVEDLLGIDEEWYYNFQHNSAWNYLVFYTGNDETLIQAFLKSSMFWGWWINAFCNRDIVFMGLPLASVRRDKRAGLYVEQHNGFVLSQLIFPGNIVWDDIKQYL